MSNELSCYGCGAGLTTTAPASQPTVKCGYCQNPNKNPNFTKAPTPHEVTGKPTDNIEAQDTSAVTEQKIVLNMSPLFSLYAGTTALASAIVGLIYIFFPQHFLVYLASGIIAILPNISNYFVAAKWEKVAQHLTTSTGELYHISYEYEAGWYQLICYIFMTTFLYDASKTLLLLKYAEISSDGKIGIFCLSFILGIGLVWFSEKVLEVVGNALGKLFSKHP